MRLFIAIELPEAIKQGIAKIQDGLKQSGGDANWTRPGGIHLTLKFLGEAPEEKVPAILQTLRDAATNRGPIRIDVAGAGAFPNLKTPRVLWVGVAGEMDKLSSLQTAVEDGMERLAFSREERKFSTHLTLARIKFPRPRDNWQQKIGEIQNVKLGGFVADHVSLMKSELRRDGAVYTEVGRMELKEPEARSQNSGERR